jgi:hypothetical protein
LRDVLIAKIKELGEAKVMPDEPAVFLMDNWSMHIYAAIQLLSCHRVKAITLLPHTSGIVQWLDLTFIGGFQRVKKHLAKNLSRR